MPTVTILSKACNNHQLKLVEKLLKSTFKGLKVKAEIYGVTSRGWVQIAVSGEDEKVASRYLASKIGLCPIDLNPVEKFSTIKGLITAVNKDELCIDIGIFSPDTIDATISLQHLQAQLADGRKIAIEKIAELFGFCENLPLKVKIRGINVEENHVEAMLSEEQIMQYRNWITSLLDRLIILGASLSEVRLALKMAKCNRDVINIEPLGLLEHAVVCKFGTDAAGLIPKIGKNLRNATFSVFNPKEILRFLGDYFIS